MNRRRIGLAVLAGGAGAFVRNRLKSRTTEVAPGALGVPGPSDSPADPVAEEVISEVAAEPIVEVAQVAAEPISEVAAETIVEPISEVAAEVVDAPLEVGGGHEISTLASAASREPVADSMLTSPAAAAAAADPAAVPGVPRFEPAPPVADITNTPGATTTAQRPRRGWRIVGGLLLGLAVVAIIAGSVIRLPYYSFRPGNVHNTIEKVDVSGELAYPPDGVIGFVTVSQTADITPWQWLDAKLDRSVSIRHRDEVRGDQTAQEAREEDLRRMTVSKEGALVLALNRLGFDLIVTPTGIEVAQVFDCTAADGVLGTGDLIVGINGNDVRSHDDLVGQLAEIGIGQDVEMLVERIDPNNPTQSIRTDLVGLTLGSADDACLSDDVRAEEPRPFIGIGTFPMFEEEFPIDIEVDTGRVGGPSAGLAITLAVMEVLSEGELTNGMTVVATGTIDREGNVGPVGGIQQKVVAAERSGADVFIVPLCCDNFVSRTTSEPLGIPSNYEEALEYAEDIEVIGVNTLDEALEAIGELGGDVEQFLG